MNVDDWDGVGSLPVLYTKTAKGAINIWQCWVVEDHVYVRWGQQDGQLQTTSFACEPKNVGRANATTAEQQAIAEAIAKWEKQVKKKYHWDPNHWDTNRNLKPMLAKDYKKQKKHPGYPAHAQPKLDGVRCLALPPSDGRLVQLLSRGGDPYSVSHIIEQLTAALPPGFILDGELYRHGTSLQTINSWVRNPQEDSVHVEYHVYDIFVEDEPNKPWAGRYDVLRDLFNRTLGGLPSIKRVTTYTVADRNHLEHMHNDFVLDGYEGAILRTLNGVYKFGYRSSDLLKYKDFQDDEFEIVGWKRGKGKFLNVPIFKCKCLGRTFEVTPMGTEAERLNMLENADSSIGKNLTVRFFNYTPDGVPFHPVGVAIREPGS